MPRPKKTKSTTRIPGQPALPQLRTHKQSGRCYATFNGRPVWFGRQDDPETQARYASHLARWLANDRKPEESAEEIAGLSVSSMVARYLRHLEEMHDKRWHENNGARLTLALAPLLELFGDELAAEFRPKKLKAVRHVMINKGSLCRSEINARVQILRKAFRWAASEELVPASISHGLDSIDHLQIGQYGVREGRARTPVSEEVVFETIEHLHPVAAALVELLWWTGARPSEIFNLCPQDIDRSGVVWVAKLKEHKNARKGKQRELDFGPNAQTHPSPLP
jgi:integrase